LDLILLNDGLYSLVSVTQEMMHLTTYYDAPYNVHVMNDGTGDFYGCICN